MAIIAASIILGKSYAFFGSFLVVSFLITFLWRKTPRPWIFLVSIVAATPIAISRQQFACNVVFALWFALLNVRYWSKLPNWIYVPFGMALLGLITSVPNWISGDVVRSIMRQGAFGCNFLLAPFLLLPLVYLRMRKSRDYAADLQGLLFCLIVPSTLVLLSAKLFGTVANTWEASLHVGDLPEGFILYRLGKVIVNFTRTEVGFILAALICASTAITVSKVKAWSRLLAGACLASNTFLLLVTASFGSILACICGLVAIFYALSRRVKVTKILVPLAVICSMVILIFALSPPSMKKYWEKRFEHRVSDADTDRLVLWGRGMGAFFEHPEGVGFTLSVGDKKKSYTHNDYLAYAVSYGVMGGLAYISLVVGLLISFFRRRKKEFDDPPALAIYLAGLGVIVAVAVNSMTDNMTANRWYFNLIWSVVWYSYFCSRARQTRTAPEEMRNTTAIAGTTASQGKSLQASG
jgi:hypothetical protein